MRYDAKGTTEVRVQQAQGAGCRVTFTNQPALSGRFAIDQPSLLWLANLVRDAFDPNIGIPLGGNTIWFADAQGNAKPFTAVQLRALYNALRTYAVALHYFKAGHLAQMPHEPTLP